MALRIPLLVTFLATAALTFAQSPAPAPAVDPATIPIETFFRAPGIDSPALSPDGKRIAYRSANAAGYFGLMVVDLDTMKPQGISPGDQDVYTYRWLGNDRLVFDVVLERLYAQGLFTYQLSRRKFSVLNRHDVTRVLSIPKPADANVYVLLVATGPGREPGIVKMDSRQEYDENRDFQGYSRNVTEILKLPPGIVVDARPDAKGIISFLLMHDNGRLQAYHRRGDKAPWSASPLGSDLNSVMAITPDGSAVYGLKRPKDGRIGLYKQSADAADGGALIFEDPRYDLNKVTLMISEQDQRVLGVRYTSTARTTHWFDPALATTQGEVDAALPGAINECISRSADDALLLFKSYNDRSPGRFYLLNRKTKALTKVGDSSPWLDGLPLATMRPLSFKTRDGLSLEAYLTLPVNPPADGSKPPLIVLPHGGPWARDDLAYDSTVQFLASRGYAVLQPNYRGSRGYGPLISEAYDFAFRQMHDDITDATQRLKRSGLIDPNRIAIMGTSFGGYLAACGVAFEPDLYRCAITVAGVFDFARLIKTYASEDDARLRVYQRDRLIKYLGDPVSNDDAFARINPISQADKIKVPVFVAHGRADAVTSIAQSKALVSALEKNQVPVQTFFRFMEGHGINNPENQLELNREIEAFLKKNL